MATKIEAPRRIGINQPGNAATDFASNESRTTKYTLLSFVPLVLAEQFSRAGNLYFLAISALQQASAA
eukprot:6177154-Pleurochrysis_carterae.AAC.1